MYGGLVEFPRLCRSYLLILGDHLNMKDFLLIIKNV